MRKALRCGIALLLVNAVGCIAPRPATYDPGAARAAIESVMPSGWHVDTADREQYDDGYFRGDARIATFGERAEDFFEITDESDRPLSADAQEALRTALEARFAVEAPAAV